MGCSLARETGSRRAVFHREQVAHVHAERRRDDHERADRGARLAALHQAEHRRTEPGLLAQRLQRQPLLAAEVADPIADRSKRIGGLDPDPLRVLRQTFVHRAWQVKEAGPSRRLRGRPPVLSDVEGSSLAVIRS